jgi:hypothetical protein
MPYLTSRLYIPGVELLVIPGEKGVGAGGIEPPMADSKATPRPLKLAYKAQFLRAKPLAHNDCAICCTVTC